MVFARLIFTGCEIASERHVFAEHSMPVGRHLSRTDTFTNTSSASVRNVNFCDAATPGSNNAVNANSMQILFISIKTGNEPLIESFALNRQKSPVRRKTSSGWYR